MDGLPIPFNCKNKHLVLALGKGNCSPSSGLLYRLVVSHVQKAKESGEERPAVMRFIAFLYRIFYRILFFFSRKIIISS